MANLMTKIERDKLVAAMREIKLANPDMTIGVAFRNAVAQTGACIGANSFNATIYHRRAFPENAANNGNGHSPAEPSPLERIRAAEQEILKAVRELDIERSQYTQRILEIDNITAKYSRKQS